MVSETHSSGSSLAAGCSLSPNHLQKPNIFSWNFSQQVTPSVSPALKTSPKQERKSAGNKTPELQHALLPHLSQSLPPRPSRPASRLSVPKGATKGEDGRKSAPLTSPHARYAQAVHLKASPNLSSPKKSGDEASTPKALSSLPKVPLVILHQEPTLAGDALKVSPKLSSPKAVEAQAVSPKAHPLPKSPQAGDTAAKPKVHIGRILTKNPHYTLFGNKVSELTFYLRENSVSSSSQQSEDQALVEARKKKEEEQKKSQEKFLLLTQKIADLSLFCANTLKHIYDVEEVEFAKVVDFRSILPTVTVTSSKILQDPIKLCYFRKEPILMHIDRVLVMQDTSKHDVHALISDLSLKVFQLLEEDAKFLWLKPCIQVTEGLTFQQFERSLLIKTVVMRTIYRFLA